MLVREVLVGNIMAGIWDSLVQLGGMGLSLLGYTKTKSAAQKMEMHYYKEAALNKQAGEFNAEVLALAGKKNLDISAQKTRAIVSAQKNEFAKRGVTLDGSAAFVIQNTIDKGWQEATEIAFNTRVDIANTLFASERASAHALAKQADAQAISKQADIDIFKSFLKGLEGVSAESAAFRASSEGSKSLASLRSGNEAVGVVKAVGGGKGA